MPTPEELVSEELAALHGESLAMQVLIIQLARQLSLVSPQLAGAISEAFDQAANLAERIALSGEGHPAQLPRALKVIEDLRRAAAGEPGPRHGV
jgi:hypothetical protein